MLFNHFELLRRKLLEERLLGALRIIDSFYVQRE